MMTRTNIIDNQDQTCKKKESTSNIFYQDIIKTTVSAVEMSQLVKRYRYDENVINKYNQIVNSNQNDDK
jgi:hypothetical protein